jgi:hypothetical protein
MSYMQVSLTTQNTNWDSSMANQGLWQEAMNRHHHCQGQDGPSNGQ